MVMATEMAMETEMEMEMEMDNIQFFYKFDKFSTIYE